MSVRIVENFWDTFQINKRLIEKCFHYNYKKFPSEEGVKESFNAFVLTLHDKDIFSKFDLNKIIPDSMRDQLGEGITEEKLEAAGINVQRRWERFIFNYTFKILSEAYAETERHNERFGYTENYFDTGIPKEDDCKWMTSEEEIAAYNSKSSNFKDDGDRRGFIYPPSFDNHVRPSEEGFDNQLEALSVADLREVILSKLTAKYCKDIYTLTEEGYNGKEIAEKLGVSQQLVNLKMKIVREVVASVCSR